VQGLKPGIPLPAWTHAGPEHQETWLRGENSSSYTLILKHFSDPFVCITSTTMNSDYTKTDFRLSVVLLVELMIAQSRRNM
jgi:hypothetical protein